MTLAIGRTIAIAACSHDPGVRDHDAVKFSQSGAATTIRSSRRACSWLFQFDSPQSVMFHTWSMALMRGAVASTQGCTPNQIPYKRVGPLLRHVRCPSFSPLDHVCPHASEPGPRRWNARCRGRGVCGCHLSPRSIRSKPRVGTACRSAPAWTTWTLAVREHASDVFVRLSLPHAAYRDSILTPLPVTDSAYRYYTELAGTYGPVFTMRYGSHRVCVITGHQVSVVSPFPLLIGDSCHPQAAMDIMVKQSHKLIDRPRYVAAGEIISAGMRTLLTRAGDRLRRLRRCVASCGPNLAVH